MARSQLSPVDWRSALVLYREHGWTIAQIAGVYGCHYATARKHLKALGLERRSSLTAHSPRTRRIYESWRSMRQRYAKASKPGAVGRNRAVRRMCQEWSSFDEFRRWAEDAGYRPGYCLTLVDRKRGHSPTNCHWLSKAEHNAAVHVYSDESARGARIRAFATVKTAAGWARDARCSVTAQTIRHRITAGMSAEKAIVTPIGQGQTTATRKRRHVFTSHAPLDWDRIVRLHVEKRWIANRIARELGVSASTVVAGLRKRGMYRAPSPGVTSTSDGVRLRTLWRSLLGRTSDRAHPLYQFNGARGIRVYRAWRDFETFAAWARHSGFESGLTLGRIQRSKAYSPTNCRWMTREEANSHRSRVRAAHVKQTRKRKREHKAH